jgi:FkbM family methyltransferase
MRKLLSQIRKNEILNFIVRSFLKYGSQLSQQLFQFLISRWPTSGETVCMFENLTFKLYNECEAGHQNLFYYNLPYPEKADLQLFIALAERSETILDIGAHTGLFSVLASTVNPKASIYAFEPYYVNADRFKKNIAINKIQNVQLLEAAMGESEGETNLAIPQNRISTFVSSLSKDFSESMYPDLAWENIPVKMMTIDTFANTISKPIDLIKCDVETFEMTVFKGAKNTIENHQPTFFFECFLDKERKQFFNQILTEQNYYVYLIFENGVVYCSEGMVDAKLGLNYILTPVKPKSTYISFSDKEILCKALLKREKSK